jgi:hypothetical protein
MRSGAVGAEMLFARSTARISQRSVPADSPGPEKVVVPAGTNVVNSQLWLPMRWSRSRELCGAPVDGRSGAHVWRRLVPAFFLIFMAVKDSLPQEIVKKWAR